MLTTRRGFLGRSLAVLLGGLLTRCASTSPAFAETPDLLRGKTESGRFHFAGCIECGKPSPARHGFPILPNQP